MDKQSRCVRLLCLLMAALVCVPSLLPFTHAHTDGQPCMACAMARQMQRLLTYLFFAFATALLLRRPAQRKRPCTVARPRRAARTPISLKIRMNN